MARGGLRMTAEEKRRLGYALTDSVKVDGLPIRYLKTPTGGEGRIGGLWMGNLRPRPNLYVYLGFIFYHVQSYHHEMEQHDTHYIQANGKSNFF